MSTGTMATPYLRDLEMLRLQSGVFGEIVLRWLDADGEYKAISLTSEQAEDIRQFLNSQVGIPASKVRS